MKAIIGFAGTYYTLWSYEDFTSKQGDFMVFETKYHYHQNVSKDINKVKMLYPNVEIDMELKGFKDFTKFVKKEFVNPFTSLLDTMPFGKYKDQKIGCVLENDPDYIIWISENSNNRGLREFAYEITTELRNKKAAAQQEKFDAIPEYATDDVVEFTVTFSKNLTTVNAHLYDESGRYMHSGAAWKTFENVSTHGDGENVITKVDLENFAYYTFDKHENLTVNLIFQKEEVKLMRYQDFIYALPLDSKTMKGIKVKGFTFKVTARCVSLEYKQDSKEQDFEVLNIEKLK